jgi:microsomal dipeptidase-like Zn-dependent dipeptidase
VGVQARFQHPINLTDDEIKNIAGCGGTICVIFMNHWLSEKPQKDGLDLIVKTIEHIRKKTGTDFISVGTDFDGFTDPPDDIKDIAEMPKFTESLLKAGFKETDIEKILGENALRVIRAGWGGETGPDPVSY